MRKQVKSGRRGLRPPSDALDQLYPETLLQKFHLQTDGRLSQPDLIGSGRKAAKIDNTDKGG
ncbi:hypothetical protein thsrh120_21030 [Rhizobium sp. No.120]